MVFSYNTKKKEELFVHIGEKNYLCTRLYHALMWAYL